MQLINIETSRVISLTLMRANHGQPFALDVLGGVVRRYNFQHFPDRVPPIGSGDGVTLSIGKFDNAQIDELMVFNDGIVVNARAPTDYIEAFIADLYEFTIAEFDMGFVPQPPEKRLYECSVVIEMDPRLAAKFDFLEGLYRDLAGFHEQYGYGDADYAFAGFTAETEAPVVGKKRLPFALARRLDVPHTANYWFASAQLRTQDLLATLANVESQLLS